MAGLSLCHGHSRLQEQNKTDFAKTQVASTTDVGHSVIPSACGNPHTMRVTDTMCLFPCILMLAHRLRGIGFVSSFFVFLLVSAPASCLSWSDRKTVLHYQQATKNQHTRCVFYGHVANKHEGRNILNLQPFLQISH